MSSYNVNIPSLAKATLSAASVYVLNCTVAESAIPFNATNWEKEVTQASADMPAFDNLRKKSDAVYTALCNVAQTRELTATTDDDACKLTLDHAAKAIAEWYIVFGTRPGKGGSIRPLVSFSHADLCIFAEATADCRNAVRNKTAMGNTLSDAWLYFMVATTARILRGEALERADLSTSIKTRKVKSETEKAAAKKEREEKKAAEKAKIEKTEKDLEKANAELADMRKKAIDVNKLAGLILASHATEEEKKEMLKVLGIDTSKQ